MTKNRPFLVAFIAAQIALGQVLACLVLPFNLNYAAIAEPEPTMTGTKILTRRIGLPSDINRVEAPPLEGGIGVLNTDKPITLNGLKGRFVVLDFWTFCCINCMHILPRLAELEQKYDDRLTVVGIHSAKFENEKDTSNISKAILRYGIKHPVVNDADFKIWDAYGVKAWPTLVLIDPDGYIIGRFSGEGHTGEIAALIDRLSPFYMSRGSLKVSTAAAVSNQVEAENKLSFPGKLIISPDKKQLLISDTGHNRIIVATFKNYKEATVETIIGTGDALVRDGPLATACFNHPQGLCINPDDWNLGQRCVYVADTGNHAVRIIDLVKQTVSTRWGTGQQAPSGAMGGGSQTSLNSPWDLTLASGGLFVAMAGSHQIWSNGKFMAPSERPQVQSSGENLSPYAGSGREFLKDGTLADADLAQPSGITSGVSSGPAAGGTSLYIADAEDSGIREINMTGGTVSTLIGKGLFIFGDKDGPAAEARLQHPLGVSADRDKLYIADSYNHKIKCLNLTTRAISTIAGTGTSGYKDGGTAQFAEPGGLFFAWSYVPVAGTHNTVIQNRIYVADTNNSVIRVITLAKEPDGENLTDTLKLVWKR